MNCAFAKPTAELLSSGSRFESCRGRARRRGRDDQASAFSDEARQFAQAMGTPYPLATALLGLARLALAEGDTARSKELFDDQLALAPRAGLALLITPGLVGLAQGAWSAGEPADARSLLKEALEIAYEYDDRWGGADALQEAIENCITQRSPINRLSSPRTVSFARDRSPGLPGASG